MRVLRASTKRLFRVRIWSFTRARLCPAGHVGPMLVGSDTDAAARDSAVVCSLALQFGTPVETNARALLRDAHGVAASPLGRALDLFVGSAP